MNYGKLRAIAHVIVDLVSLYSEEDQDRSDSVQEAALAPLREIPNGAEVTPAVSMLIIKRLVRQLAQARGVEEDFVLGELREWIEIDFEPRR